MKTKNCPDCACEQEEHNKEAYEQVKLWLAEFGEHLSKQELANITEACRDIADVLEVLEPDEHRGALMYLFLLTYTNEFVQEYFVSRQIGAFKQYRKLAESFAPQAWLN